jgi:hypothetical protein
MAKQRGIHQISGKINNLCYYEQKYVRGGLIRRINEAMSERLKTDPVFENTRHSNTIFGGCSMMSGLLLSFFGSRNTYLFKPYRHALLTRAVKKYLLIDHLSEEYPMIFEREKCYRVLPQIISGIVKNSIFTSFPELDNHYDGLELSDAKDFTFNYDSLVAFCNKYKCIGVQLSVSRAHYIYSASYQISSNGYVEPENNAGGRGSYINWYLDYDTDNVVLSTTTGDIDDAATFWIVYAIPILSKYQDRPILGETGASCGIVTFLAS